MPADKLRKYVHNALVEYIQQNNDETELKKDLEEYGPLMAPVIVLDAVCTVVEGTKADFRAAMPGLLASLAKQGIVRASMISDALSTYVDNPDTYADMEMDFPNIASFLGSLLGALAASNTFPLTSLTAKFSPEFKAAGYAGDLLVQAVASMAKAAGAAKAASVVSDSGVGLCCTWLAPARARAAIATLKRADALRAFPDLQQIAALCDRAVPDGDVDAVLSFVSDLPNDLRRNADFCVQVRAARVSACVWVC